MQYYLAPMEGITRYLYRNIHRKHFCTFDKYVTPFISMSRKIPPKAKKDIIPEHNEGIAVIPQFMVANAFETQYLSDKISEFGYNEFNINAGCPSGTVVTKYRGAGLLRDTEKLKSLLDELYSKDLKYKYSIKLRLGYENVSEWENIANIISQYPFSEVMIHCRVRSEFYNGTPHKEAMHIAKEKIKAPLCYNGDIYSANDLSLLSEEFPWLDRVMIGRGILRNPGLLDELITGTAPSSEQIYSFMEDLFDSYLDLFNDNIHTLYHIKELWFYLGQTHPECERDLKIIRKTKSIPEYKEAARRVLLSK